MKQHIARLVTALIGIAAMLVVPGTAFAYTNPNEPDTGASVPLAHTVNAVTNGQTTAPATSSLSWLPALGIGVAVGVAVAMAVLLVAQRVRRERQAHRPAFGV
jgi:hypothetical protein